MTPRDRLIIAGDAAELIERAGFSAVARMKDGVVTLDFWGPQGGLRRVVHEESPDPESLAEECITQLGGPKRKPGGVLS